MTLAVSLLRKSSVAAPHEVRMMSDPFQASADEIERALRQAIDLAIIPLLELDAVKVAAVGDRTEPTTTAAEA